VHEAKIPQPLCTALQLALVDTLAAIGIKPAAMMGHSSSKIAAAYASGGLTTAEAITVAFSGTKSQGQHPTWRDGQSGIGPRRRIGTSCPRDNHCLQQLAQQRGSFRER
jgi:acyl transferase domain-containing protein